jgi:DNA-binding transcriptional LysR family regulator
MLRDDVLDLAFLSVTERIESHGLVLHQLVSEKLVAVLPRDHPLAPRRRLRMAELADEQFVSYREGARLRELLTYAAHQAGFEPQIKLESNESERIRRLVGRGMGVAILPKSDADRSAGNVAVVSLIEPSLRRDITLACREGRRLSPAASEFMQLSREVFSRQEVDAEPTDARARADRPASRADPRHPAVQPAER